MGVEQRGTCKKAPKVGSAGKARRGASLQSPLAPGYAHENLRMGLVSSIAERLRFRATVVRLGTTRGRKAWRKQTVLLRNVAACGADTTKMPIAHTDHVWLTVGKQLGALALRHSDT